MFGPVGMVVLLSPTGTTTKPHRGGSPAPSMRPVYPHGPYVDDYGRVYLLLPCGKTFQAVLRFFPTSTYLTKLLKKSIILDNRCGC